MFVRLVSSEQKAKNFEKRIVGIEPRAMPLDVGAVETTPARVCVSWNGHLFRYRDDRADVEAMAIGDPFRSYSTKTTTFLARFRRSPPSHVI